MSDGLKTTRQRSNTPQSNVHVAYGAVATMTVGRRAADSPNASVGLSVGAHSIRRPGYGRSGKSPRGGYRSKNCGWCCKSARDVRYTPESNHAIADVRLTPDFVRFTPVNGHYSGTPICPFLTQTGHPSAANTRSDLDLSWRRINLPRDGSADVRCLASEQKFSRTLESHLQNKQLFAVKRE